METSTDIMSLPDCKICSDHELPSDRIMNKSFDKSVAIEFCTKRGGGHDK